jgi:site-specific recombinase XerD
MARQWFKTQFPGVRYRKHPTRKKGVKFDQYFSIRYKLDGRDVEEGIGWASEGNTASDAYDALGELKRNHKSGKGPRTLAEKRELEEKERQEAEQAKALEAARNITWGEVWQQYIEHAKGTKAKNSVRTEKNLKGVWIDKAIPEATPMHSISPFHLEKVRNTMTKAGKAPRTIQYTLSTIRAVFNFARRHDLFNGENPTGRIRMPKFDNRRMRFLTRDEADRLLKKLAETSKDVHDKALLSLYAGLRLGEINSLTWGDVDIDHGVLTLRDTKNTRTRAAYLTDQARQMLIDRRPGEAKPTDLIFPGSGGKKSYWTSATFSRTVKALGLNDGVTDRRQRVTFHTCRHSFASWLVENGTDLYTVKELLGHSDFRMTARYSHLSNSSLRAAVARLEETTAGAVVELDMAKGSR